MKISGLLSLERVSIRFRLIALSVIAASVCIGLGAIGFWKQQASAKVATELEVTAQIVRAAMLTDMMHDAIHAEVVSAAFARATDNTEALAAAQTSLKENIQVLKESYASAISKAPNEALSSVLNEAKPVVENYAKSAEAAVEAMRTGADPKVVIASFNQPFEETKDALDKVGDLVEASATKTTEFAHAQGDRAARWTVGALVIGLGVLLLLTPPLVVSILRPIKRMLDAVSTLNTDDGDLSHRLPPLHAEFEKLSKEFNLFLDKITAVVAEVHLSASNIGTASSEIAAGNMDLSNRTEGAAHDLQVTASNVDHLTGAVNHTVDVANQARDLASGASGVAQQGNAVMSSMITTMEDINDASRKISDIIGVIDGIAFQTNILALNAAVEAARAGEQGRGFAVVAGEVRSLAQRSAGAAREIKTLIGSSVDKVESGFKLVRGAGETMNDIVASVQKVNDLIEEITVAAAQQQSGFQAINQAVLALDRKTQENAALVEEQAAAAESLRQQTVQLNNSIEGFKLSKEGLSVSDKPGVVKMF
ncbi:MAG: methyl-accepting chemotaxis protein [Aquabacterium sp.]